MGAFFSKEGCEFRYSVTLNCSQNATFDNATHKWSPIGDAERGTFGADPDIAGIGVSSHLFLLLPWLMLISNRS